MDFKTKYIKYKNKYLKLKEKKVGGKKFSKVLILSYENDKLNQNKIYLEDKLKKYEYEYKFLGEGEEWNGFGTKIKSYQEYIKKNTKLNDEDILVLIDSRDIYVNRSSKELIEEFKNYYEKNGGDLDKNLKLIFSSEIACCTPGIYENDKDKMKFNYLNRNYNLEKKNFYLNSGMCIGYVKAFKRIYLNIEMNKEDDDQTKITKYWLNDHSNNIILDYENKLLSNAHVWGNEKNLDGCKYSKKNDNFILTDFNESPFFIQTPAKYWKCYKYLYNIE